MSVSPGPSPLAYAVSGGQVISIDKSLGAGAGVTTLTLTADVQFLSPAGWPTEPGATGSSLIITPGTVLPAGTTMQFLSTSAVALLAANVAEIPT